MDLPFEWANDWIYIFFLFGVHELTNRAYDFICTKVFVSLHSNEILICLSKIKSIICVSSPFDVKKNSRICSAFNPSSKSIENN